MRHHTLQLTYFFALFLLIGALTLFTFLPYLAALFFAIVVAIIFWPIHQRIAEDIPNQFIAALLSTLFVILVIGIPLTFFAILLFEEVSTLYGQATGSGGDILNVAGWVEGVAQSIQNISPPVASFLSEQSQNIDQANYVNNVFNWLLGNIQTFFSQAVHIVVSLALGVLALFYLFKDGDDAVRYVKQVSPLAPEHDGQLMDKCLVAVNSVIRGRVLASIIQGILAGIAFAIVGIPAPVLWGSIAGLISVVPMLGPGLVITPAVIYLFAIGNVWGAVGLLIWAFIAVYFIDDIFEPVFINRGMHIHPLLILVSILGGLSLMGPIGFVAGPVMLSVFFAMLEMYPVIMRGKDAEVTAYE